MFQSRLPLKVASLGLACTLLTATLPPAFAQMQMQNGQTGVVIQQQSHTLPAGTILSIRETSFAADNGDIFIGQLVSPIRANGEVIIPAGSAVQGHVVATDPVSRMRNIQLSTLTLPSGNVIAFDSSIAAAMPVAQAAVREEPLTGQVTRTGQGVTTFFPRISMGPEGATPAARVIGSTVGGAALGAATGTLTGLTIAAASKDSDIRVSKGSMAARGLAWGSAYGAGFGLLTGLIAEAANPTPVAVTTTRNVISTQPTGQVLNVALAEPVTIGVGTVQVQQTSQVQEQVPVITQQQPVAPATEGRTTVRGFY
jgi:hypothetical protein